jgi:RND family efflux transporter MFP subunit
MKKILYTVAIFAMVSCGNEKIKEEADIKQVVFAIIGNQSDGELKTFNGKSQSGTENSLSFRTNGLITDLKVKNGEKVRKGQVLAKVDTKDISLAYDKAKASVASAKSQMNTLKSSLDRTKKLYQTNGASLSDLEQAKNAFKNAEANYNTALKAQNIQGSQFEYAKIIAPTDGIITAVNASENEFAKAGTPIIIVNSIGSDLEISVGVPESFISKISNSMTADIKLNNKTYQGIVTEVAFSVGNNFTYPVIVKIEKPSEDLRPGMPAEVTFNIETQTEITKTNLIVPVKAVSNDSDGDFVYKLIKNEGETYSAKRVLVKLGTLKDNGFEIIEGLKNGDLVATAGLRSLYDGMIVNLMK